jgi:raffinose/stachyose/melibiose transport system permease protein
MTATAKTTTITKPTTTGRRVISLAHSFGAWWQYAIALAFSAIFGFPVVWMVYSSFKPTKELLRNVWALPINPTIHGYTEIFSSSSFGTYYQNTIILTLTSVPVLVVVSAMAAYAFARVKFRGRNLMFYLFLAGTMIPVHVTLIPLFAMMRDMGLIGKLPAMILPFVGFGLPVSIYILRGFFEQIPIELEEAARIDGCSTPRIFWSIMLPLARPALVTVTILSVVSAWNEFLFALTLVAGNNKAYTLPLGIVAFVRSLGITQYDKMFAGLTITALPVLIFYFLAQRQIIKSLTAGAVKG